MRHETKPPTRRLDFYCWECKQSSHMDIPAGITGTGHISVKCPEGHIVKAPMNQNRNMIKVFPIHIQGFNPNGTYPDDGEQCLDCGSLKLNKTPVGDGCNVCGWSYPGYPCKTCGRECVSRKHLNKDGQICSSEGYDDSGTPS